MTIGYIGLGKMGQNMTLRLLEQGIKVVAFNRSPEPISQVAKAGATAAGSLTDLVSRLPAPRTIWIMVPQGKPVDEIISRLSSSLSAGDLIIDGGNSFYRDSIRRAKELAKSDLHFMDIGVSGGPRGARTGACLMVGGSPEDFRKVKPVITAASAPSAYQHVGPVGAGHFVKMVHNGIEYGMMQAIAEGFNIMKYSAEFDLDLVQVADVYNHASVIESRLIGWMKSAFEKFGPDLKEVTGTAAATGEGEWTAKTAQELGIPAAVITAALKAREYSRRQPNYAGRIISALRNQFGGHSVTPK